MKPVREVSATPNRYRVLTDGTGKQPAGLILGYVRLHADGWRFVPHFQSSPSRKGWPTADAALTDRVMHYRLEPLA